MGSLAVQPPSGVTRSLTEVFVFLRNNSLQNQVFGGADVGFKSDDKMSLIAIEEDEKVIAYNKNPPTWVNVIDEVNYELTRIKSRTTALREVQQRQLSILDFSEEKSSPEQEKVREFTEELSSMFGHCRRLIRLLEEAEPDRLNSYNKLRQNVIASLMQLLNGLMHEFSAGQSAYLRHLDSRKNNLDSFLVKSNIPEHYLSESATNFENKEEEELTIDQIQQIMENEHMTKEREKEVIRISKSILELNSIFKDIAAMIVDQGTILDRIDYNVEQSASRIKSAFKSVKKAEKYQQNNKKLQLILVLAGFALFLMLLIIITKI